MGGGAEGGGEWSSAEVASKVEEVWSSVSRALEERSRRGVRVKLDNLVRELESGRVEAGVQRRLCELLRALEAGKVESAYEIHSTMMVDFVSQVSPWMPGIRSLLLQLRRKT